MDAIHATEDFLPATAHIAEDGRSSRHILNLNFLDPDNHGTILFTFSSPHTYASRADAEQDAPRLYADLTAFAAATRKHCSLYVVLDEADNLREDFQGRPAIYRTLSEAIAEANSLAHSPGASEHYFVETLDGDTVYQTPPDAQPL